jgi:hypothetical protein
MEALMPFPIGFQVVEKGIAVSGQILLIKGLVFPLFVLGFGGFFFAL